MALSKTTQNHDEIKAWAEKRGGRPADVESTETANEAGILRLEFPDAPNANDANLKEIDWEPFFEKFDKSGLAMVYQEITAEGAESNFYKFVHPENLAGSTKKSAAKKTTAKKASTSTPKKTGTKTAPASKANATPAKKVAVKQAGGSKSAPVKKTAPVKPASAKTSASKPAATKVAAKTASAKVPAKKAAAAKKAAKKK